MYCEKCGKEIEPSVICPKCGCLSGYRDSELKVKSVKINDLPVKIISGIGIFLFLLVGVPFCPAMDGRWLVFAIVGIVFFVSFFVKKLEKIIRILFPIGYIIYTLSGLYNTWFVLDFFQGVKSVLFGLLGLISPILIMIYICKKNKFVGIISITLAFICFILAIVPLFSYGLGLSYFMQSSDCFPSFLFLLFTIAIFLCYNKKSLNSEIKTDDIIQ